MYCQELEMKKESLEMDVESLRMEVSRLVHDKNTLEDTLALEIYRKEIATIERNGCKQELMDKTKACERLQKELKQLNTFIRGL